jgi:TetR/AcrR family transcriptional repressor of nem operon
MSTTQAPDSSSTDRSPTAERILDCAQERIQERGYNAVSYGDLAAELDLTTAAIHYHFPSKADLVRALVVRYRQAHAKQRAAICEDVESLRGRLERYVALFVDVLNGGGLCLCGVLASDAPTLPDEVRAEVRRFFADQEEWLAAVVEAGEGPPGAGLEGCETPREVAELVLATVEGAMLTIPARDPDAYARRLRHLVDSVVT